MIRLGFSWLSTTANRGCFVAEVRDLAAAREKKKGKTAAAPPSPLFSQADWEQQMKINQQKKERENKERLDANKNVLRSYRISPRK